MFFSETEVAFRLLMAFLLGAIIGVERHIRHRRMGLKTAVLVSLGAAGFVVASSLFGTQEGTVRIAAQIVSGIGFLCGGLIFKEGLSVHGINTAATIWCTAAVGVACGTGFYSIAGILTIMLVFSNIFFGYVSTPVEKLIDRFIKAFQYELVIDCTTENQESLRQMLAQQSETNDECKLKQFTQEELNGQYTGNLVRLRCIFASDGPNDEFLDRLVALLLTDGSVRTAHWNRSSSPNRA